MQLRILEILTIGAAFVLHYVPYNRSYILQGRNDRENLGATTPMVGRICPPGWNMVKVSETLGATTVVPVALVNTSLHSIPSYIS